MGDDKNRQYKDVLHNRKRRGIKEDILDLRSKGKSYREIQSILECSKGTIAYHAKKSGMDGTIDYTHHMQLSEKEKKDIYDFTKNNKNVAAAIRELGYCRKTILKYGCFEKV